MAFLQNIPLLNRLLPVTKPDTTAQSILLKNIAVKYGEKVADEVNTVYKVDVKTTPLKGYQVTDLLHYAGRVHGIFTKLADAKAEREKEVQLSGLKSLYPPAASTIEQATKEWRADPELQKTVDEREYVAVKVYADPAHREEINTKYLANVHDNTLSLLAHRAIMGFIQLELDEKDPASPNKWALSGQPAHLAYTAALRAHSEAGFVLESLKGRTADPAYVAALKARAEAEEILQQPNPAEKIFYTEDLKEAYKDIKRIQGLVNEQRKIRSAQIDAFIEALPKPIDQTDTTVDTQPNKTIPTDSPSIGN